MREVDSRPDIRNGANSLARPLTARTNRHHMRAGREMTPGGTVMQNVSHSSILVMLAGALALGACAPLARLARSNPASVVSQGSEQCRMVSGLGGGQAFAINLDCYRFPGAPASARTAYQEAITESVARNRLEAVLIRQADTICEVEKGYIYANEAVANSFFDFTSTSLSVASTIVGGDQAKSILSGLAGLSTATKTNITAHVYKNQIVPAITNVMDAERQRILTSMIARRSETTAGYPADEMIRLANSYHQACSFQNGVQVLLKASVNKAGSDALIKTINLRYALANLKASLTDYKAMNAARLADPDVAAKIKSMEDKLVELSLEMTANAQTAQGAAVATQDD